MILWMLVEIIYFEVTENIVKLCVVKNKLKLNNNNFHATNSLIICRINCNYV